MVTAWRCHHVQVEREGDRDAAEGPGGVLGFKEKKCEAWLDLVHQVEAVWANSSPLPAMCLL